MANWKVCTLDELGAVVGGATPSTKNLSNYGGGSIVWITPKDLSNHRGRFIAQGERNITETGLNSCGAQMMPKHSVLFSSRAPIGYVAISECEVCTNQGFKSIVPNENTDYMFLYYLLLHNRENIENMGSGTTFKEVSGKTMKGIEVRVPVDKAYQQRIADIFSALDDKIELNERINHNLEQQALTLFRSWFINFEPFSEDGTMPSLWSTGYVSDIIELHDSRRIPLSGSERDKMEKVYPYYGATSLMDYVDNYLFDGIYLLLGEDGTVIDSLGFPILQYVDGKFWVNNHAHILTGKRGYSVEELYLFFRLTNIRSIVTGAVQQKVSQANLKKVPAVLPPEDCLHAFDELIQPLFAQIRNLRNESNRLTQLRDALLPKLMSGELDVSEVDI